GQAGGNGAALSTWDNNISNNFASGTTVVNYLNSAPVSFLDTNAVTAGAITNSTVSIQAAGVTPASVTFNNSAVAYTLNNVSGVIGLAGTGTLAKSGTALLTISSPNTFTGGTTISAGTVVLGTSAATLGNVSLTGGNAIPGGSILRGAN